MNREEIAAMVQDSLDGNTEYLFTLSEIRKEKMLLDDELTFLKQAESEIIEGALLECEGEEKTFDKFGCTLTQVNGAAMYDFKHIQEVVDAEAKLKALKEKYKHNYKSSKLDILGIASDGEVLELPKVTYRKDSITLKLKR
mgnify:CR=1 FL=1